MWIEFIGSATNKRTSYSGSGTSISYDTSSYNYLGSNFDYELRRSTSNSVTKYNFTLVVNMYTQEVYSNGILAPAKTYYSLNSMGLVDSFWIMNSNTVTQSARYWRNADGSTAREIHHYQGYDNDLEHHYQNGELVYSISIRIAYSPSISNARDSMLYTYDPLLKNYADHYNAGLPPSLYTKASKNLVKKLPFTIHLITMPSPKPGNTNM